MHSAERIFMDTVSTTFSSVPHLRHIGTPIEHALHAHMLTF